MNNSTIVVLIISGICNLLIVSFGFYSLRVSKKTIFSGSGKPEKMASIVLDSIYLMAKNLVGVFIITAVLILISENLINNEQGLPVITLVVGYLLGKEFVTSKKSSDSKTDE